MYSKYKAIYTLRKETIERVFADAKEKALDEIYSFSEAWLR